MPYGMKGGDTPKTTKWMEDCVTAVTGNNKRTGLPYSKSDKIAICKAQYEKKGQASIEIDQDVLDRIDKLREDGVNYFHSEAKYYKLLENTDYSIDLIELLVS
jgi:uncharacterized protein (DUF4415 family)